jgi:hypothetical protein
MRAIHRARTELLTDSDRRGPIGTISDADVVRHPDAAALSAESSGARRLTQASRVRRDAPTERHSSGRPKRLARLSRAQACRPARDAVPLSRTTSRDAHCRSPVVRFSFGPFEPRRRSKAAATPVGDVAAVRVGHRSPESLREPLPPARIARLPAELALGLRVRGAPRLGHHERRHLTGRQSPSQRGMRLGGLASSTLANTGSHSRTGAGSSSTML